MSGDMKMGKIALSLLAFFLGLATEFSTWTWMCTETGVAPKDLKYCNGSEEVIFLTWYVPNGHRMTTTADDIWWNCIALVRGNYIDLNLENNLMYPIYRMYALLALLVALGFIISFYMILMILLLNRVKLTWDRMLGVFILMIALLLSFLGIGIGGFDKRENGFVRLE